MPSPFDRSACIIGIRPHDIRTAWNVHLFRPQQLMIMDHPDNQYSTMTAAVNDLQALGYTDELTLTEDGLFNNATPLDPKEFTIDSFHRFEGPSDPADMAIIYAVTSKRLGLKGLLIGEYGSNAQDFIHQMVQPLQAHRPEETERSVQPVRPGANLKT